MHLYTADVRGGRGSFGFNLMLWVVVRLRGGYGVVNLFRVGFVIVVPKLFWDLLDLLDLLQQLGLLGS